jgi:predicted phage-related endonuclease
MTPRVKTVDLASVRHFVAVLEYVKAEKAKLSELEKQAREVIEEALGDKEIGVLDNQHVVSWTKSERRAVSIKKLKDEFPAVAETCTEVTQVRTFKLIDPSE